MRKKLILSLICSLVFMSMVLTPTLIAARDYDDDIRCKIQITLVKPEERPPTWDGKIKGDIKGKFGINLIGAAFLDSDLQPVDQGDPNAVWEIYWEVWVIKTKGGEITVLQAGVWSFETFIFRSNGPVLDAPKKWAYLIGSTMYVLGQTNNPFEDWPVIGTGEMWINFDDDCHGRR